MWLTSALDALREGRIVAVATESYFALAGDATRASVLDALLGLKGRQAEKGIGLLVPSSGWRPLVHHVPPLAERLTARFWPGPLTLVLPARASLDVRLVVDGCVGMRVPGTSPALELVQAWGGPLTATSANVSGQPPCRTSAEVSATFGQVRELFVLEGEAPGGQVSTLVRLDAGRAQVLRAGAVSEQVLTQFVDSVD